MSFLQTQLSRTLVRTAATRAHATVRVGAIRSTHSAANSPLNAHTQPKTGVQPSYGPVGVAAALKHQPTGASVPSLVLTRSR